MFSGLGRMPRHAQLQRLVDVTIGVRELNLEHVNRIAQRHASPRMELIIITAPATAIFAKRSTPRSPYCDRPVSSRPPTEIHHGHYP